MLKPIAATLLGTTAAAPAAAQLDLPKEMADGMYPTLAAVHANRAATVRAFTGPQGGPISKQQFISAELPPDVVPSTSARELPLILFKQLDANGNASVSFHKWSEGIERDLGFAVKNDAGPITLEELSRAPKNMSVGDALTMIS